MNSISSHGAEVRSIRKLLLKQSNNMIIRKVSGLWIVEREHSGQIVFSHKNQMTCYEWMFKGINYA